MDTLTAEELMAVCDAYFALETDDGAFVRAYNQLAGRGPEIRDWSRSLLAHDNYEAREAGAFLLGRLGARSQLGAEHAAVVTELGAAARRPVGEEGKEMQAVDSAILALGEIGGPDAVSQLGGLLFRDRELGTEEWPVGDIQWAAADALGRAVGEPFMGAADPVAAARAWWQARQGQVGRA